MAKKVSFQFKGLDKLPSLIQDVFTSIVNKDEVVAEIAETIIKDIKYQTRRGISPVTGQKFKPLSTKKHPFLYGFYGNLKTKATTELTRKTKWSRRNEFIRVSKAKAIQVREGYSWIDIRRAISDSQPTHPAFKDDRSNLTLTGKLLDSIKYENKGSGRVRFYFEGQHHPYKLTNTRGRVIQIGSRMDNADLAGYVEAGGRPFFGVRKSLEPRISRILVAAIRRNYRLMRSLNKK